MSVGIPLWAYGLLSTVLLLGLIVLTIYLYMTTGPGYAGSVRRR